MSAAIKRPLADAGGANSALDISHAARKWHTIHLERMGLNAELRAMAKASAPGRQTSGSLLAYRTVKERITATKQRERAALRALGKACAQQRAGFNDTDIIDVEVKLICQPAGDPQRPTNEYQSE